MISVTYTNTPRDSMAFMGHWTLRSAVTWSSLGLFVAVLLPGTLRELKPEWPLWEKVFVGFFMLAVPVIIVVAITAIITTLMYALYRNPGVHTTHTITADSDGLRETTPVNDTTFTWDGVRRVSRSKGHIYIFIGPWTAHLIPRRAVADQHEWERLYADLVALKLESKRLTSASS